MALKVIKLTKDTPILPFHCCDEDLNNYLHEDALNYANDLMAVTYLFVDTEANKTMAYYSILNDKVAYNPSNRTIWNRINRLVTNKKRRKSYPSVKVGRLAVSEEYMKQGIGSDILTYIKVKSVTNQECGCRFLTVDAYANVTDFYRKNGFEFFTMSDALDSTRLMYFDLKTVKEQIDNLE
mgnify:CR=1 FL=1